MHIKTILRKHWSEILLGVMILTYIGYFTWFTILRYQTLYAHYFDLGIMQQTVYNTFMSLKTGDLSRFLELTNPHGFDQVKRMSVHNDMFLALLAPFYFLYSGPEMLLIIQSVGVGLGALAIYGISKMIFEKTHGEKYISLLFAFGYLMYPPLQRANQFDFHAVVLATPLLVFMYYLYLKKKYIGSLICALGALLTKEQVGLTLAFFGCFVAFMAFKKVKQRAMKKHEFLFSAILVTIGIGWFIVSMMYIIPYFRQGVHFALTYFGDFGDSPQGVFFGILKNPFVVLQYLLKKDTLAYFLNIFGPIGFLSFLSPLHLFIAAPEFSINILSRSDAMRNIYFHYSAVTTPFVMLSAMYGYKNLLHLMSKIPSRFVITIICGFMFILGFSYYSSPLPYSKSPEVHPVLWPNQERFEAFKWQKILSDEGIKVMASGHIGPLFSSRRYFYNFSERYDLADYIVLSHNDVYNGYENEKAIPAYQKLVKDVKYSQIYKSGTFEVYKKI